MSEHETERRIDLKALVDEVRQMREEQKPIREFMQKVDAARTAAIWVLGIITAIGAAIKWFLDVKQDLRPHG